MSTTADIQKYGRNRDGFVEYFIRVVHNGRIWGVKKRFSEFVQLHEYLQKSGYTLPASLPKKTTVWKKVDEKLLKKRSKELQLYINELLKTFSVADNSLLKEFLEVEVNWLTTAKKSQSFKSVERLELIPAYFAKMTIPIPQSRVKTSPFYVRNANGQVIPTTAAGPHLNKTKSLSFSMRSPARKDSIQVDNNNPNAGYYQQPPSIAKERKFSMDIFNLSNNSGLADQAALHSAVKKTQYLKSTDALWNYYRSDIQLLCDEGDEDVEYDNNYFLEEEEAPAMKPGLLRRGALVIGENNNSPKGLQSMQALSSSGSRSIDSGKIQACFDDSAYHPYRDSSVLEVAQMLEQLENHFLHSHLNFDPFHWNEEVICVLEFKQVGSSAETSLDGLNINDSSSSEAPNGDGSQPRPYTESSSI